MKPNERRSILTKLYFFALRAPIQYKTIIVEKKECRDVFGIEAKLAHGELSKSEQYIFHSKKAFYKDFVRRLEKKQL